MNTAARMQQAGLDTGHRVLASAALVAGEIGRQFIVELCRWTASPLSSG
jgi:hypothetical protein